MAKTPSHIYAILAYSKSLNITKRIFDQDALLAPYEHTLREGLAKQKAEAFAAQLNTQRHRGVDDWTAKVQKQAYKTRGQTRANEVISPTQRIRGW